MIEGRKSGAHLCTRESVYVGDVDGAMRFMDRTYDARFSSWVQKPENMLLVSFHLRRITAGYDPRIVAHGVRWIANSWTESQVTTLLHGIALHQPTDYQGRLINGVTADWPLLPNTVPIFARFIHGRSPQESAVFVKAATEDWDEGAVCDLVVSLELHLHWKNAYFHDFIVQFVHLCRGSFDQNMRARNMFLLLQLRFSSILGLTSGLSIRGLSFVNHAMIIPCHSDHVGVQPGNKGTLVLRSFQPGSDDGSQAYEIELDE